METVYSTWNILVPKNMLFHNYLEKLLGSKAKVKILRELIRYGTKKFTSRELAVQTSLSHTAVLKAFPELEEMDIVNKESHGTSNLITINQESYCYSFLKQLFEAEEKTIEELKQAIKYSLPEAEIIILFGSIAEKKEEINSDIDLLVITKEKDLCEENIAKMQNSFSQKFGNVIAAQILTKQEFEKKKSKPFIRDLLSKKYILLKGAIK